jgi:hypothetical protein
MPLALIRVVVTEAYKAGRETSGEQSAFYARPARRARPSFVETFNSLQLSCGGSIGGRKRNRTRASANPRAAAPTDI